MKLAHSYSAIKMYDNCAYRYFRQRIQKDVVDEGGEASKHGERIHKYFENRLKDKVPLPDEVAKHEKVCQSVERIAENGELYVEHELVLTENLTPTGWWDADAWLRSKLDVLVILGDTAIVIDWKTGKRRVDTFQMDLFAAQTFKHFPQVQKVKTSLVWLKTNEMDTELYTRININERWAEIMGKIQRIYMSLEHDNWPAKPSGLCRYCPARHDCDDAQI